MREWRGEGLGGLVLGRLGAAGIPGIVEAESNGLLGGQGRWMLGRSRTWRMRWQGEESRE